MECSDTHRDILMAAGADSLNNAAAAGRCNKMKNSIGPYWLTQERFWRIRSQVRALGEEGYNQFCWHGGRNLIYAPYIRKAG